MTSRPLLSIVTPTRGNFSEYWFEQLLKVEGNVQFVLVYPPGVKAPDFSDPRIKSVISPYKGEVMQRFVGLLNATGEYVLALDDDDFVHPSILKLVTEYSQAFPESWVLRLSKIQLNYTDEANIKKAWEDPPELSQLKIARRREGPDSILQEIPIAPLTNKFDYRYLVNPYLARKDMHGAHIENFNNKVWKNEIVQKALAELSQTMRLKGSLSWIPFWNLDRSLGLFVQACSFQEGIIIGHWMPKPEQIRYIIMSQSLKKEFRLMLPSDALLAKRFPQYGYFWNLVFEQGWVALRKFASNLVSFK
jgi:hypothetical protein